MSLHDICRLSAYVCPCRSVRYLLVQASQSLRCMHTFERGCRVIGPTPPGPRRVWNVLAPRSNRFQLLMVTPGQSHSYSHLSSSPSSFCSLSDNSRPYDVGIYKLIVSRHRSGGNQTTEGKGGHTKDNKTGSVDRHRYAVTPTGPSLGSLILLLDF